jgi:predicted nucleotide-binding protein
MGERVRSLPALERNVLREVSENLRVSGEVPSTEDVPLILSALIRELSTAALSEADIDNLEARAFEEESTVERPRERAKPRVFISSSAEGLAYARALEGYLEQFAISQIWNEQEFNLGRPILENLIRTVSKFDFAALVFTEDDYFGIAKARGFARSNVAFEAGLFVGRLGIQRTFFVAPRASMRQPSDLAGVPVLTYDPQIPSTDTIRPAAYQILKQIQRLGPVGSKEPRQY